MRATKKLFCGLAILAMLAGMAFLSAGNLSAFPVSASLTGIEGDVQVRLPGGSWQPGVAGMSLPSGADVKTGAKSTAVIKWSTANVMKLTPFTNFSIKDIDVDPRSKTVVSSLDLQTGKIKAKAEKLKNPNSEFSISTPTAVAGVRGTIFDMENTPENTVNLQTYEGAVDLTAQGETVSVGAGEKASVPQGETPKEPEKVPEEEKNKCEDDQDCWSGTCVEGKCQNEEAAVSKGGCMSLEASCARTSDCCEGACMEGVCMMPKKKEDKKDDKKAESDKDKKDKKDKDKKAEADKDKDKKAEGDKDKKEEAKAAGDDGKKEGDKTAVGSDEKDDGGAASDGDKDGEEAHADATGTDDGDGGVTGDDGSVPTDEGDEGAYDDEQDEEAVAACIQDEESCFAHESCCSGNCDFDSGLCKQPGTEEAAACLETGESCVMGDECCSTFCVNGACSAEPAPEMFVNAEVSRDTVVLSQDDTFEVRVSTVDGANCTIGDSSVVASGGSASANITAFMGGEMVVSVQCQTEDGQVAATTVQVTVVEPLTLTVSTPQSGYRECSDMYVSGFTSSDATLELNKTPIEIKSDGSFELRGYRLDDCSQDLIFNASDNFGQSVSETVSSGLYLDPAAIGVEITNQSVDVRQGTGWRDGSPEIIVSIMIESSTPIVDGLAVQVFDGTSVIAAPLVIGPSYDDSVARVASAMVYTASLKYSFYPVIPANVDSETFCVGVGDVNSFCSEVQIAPQEFCVVTPNVPGDGIDNDCDGSIDEETYDKDNNTDTDEDGKVNEDTKAVGELCNDGYDKDGDKRVDEEAIDGIDNDNDGRIDEDTFCSSCGNGIKEIGEACDDSQANGLPNKCNATCSGITPSVCGNGTVESGETCDDGNLVTEACAYGSEKCNVCDAGCQTVAGVVSYCGDGVLDSANNERCDDGAENGQPNMCNSSCGGATLASCGNGVVEAGEACDSAGVNSAACNVDCTAASCGDGILNAEAGEICDLGSRNTDVACAAAYDSTCSYCDTKCAEVEVVGASCGDGVTDRVGGESCDDGANNGVACVAGYGADCSYCDTTCQTATVSMTGSCGDGVVDRNYETCDDGANNGVACVAGYGADCSYCDTTCQTATVSMTGACGDGIIDPSYETCDDGPSNGIQCIAVYGADCSYCDTTCQTATVPMTGSCGDGVVDAGFEACDYGTENGVVCVPGYQSSCDWCSASCDLLPEVGGNCGDGVWDAGYEACDDGINNGMVGMCNATCDAMIPSTCYTKDDCGSGMYCDLVTSSCSACDPSIMGDGICCFDEDFTISADCDSYDPCAGYGMDEISCLAAPYGCGFAATVGCHTPGMSLCSNIPDMATCDSDPACMWDATTFTCGEAAPMGCALYNSDQITCESSPENCYWDMGVMDCFPNYVMDPCNSYVDMATCETDQLCVWDAANMACINYGYSVCGGYVDQITCAANGCTWNGVDCYLGETSGCGTFMDQITCESDPGCMWDPGMLICGPGAPMGCALYNSDQITCESSPENCYWDAAAFDCFPNMGGCEAYGDQVSCETDGGCFWNIDLLFCEYYSGGSSCPGYIDMATCDSDPMCQWDANMMVCNDAPVTGCALYNSDQTTCETSPYSCYWDLSTFDCYPNTGGGCASYGDMATCESDVNCLWDAGLMICSDGAGTGCVLYNSDQATCETSPENCYWDAVAMDCFPNGGGGCGSYVDAANCDMDPGCTWNIDLAYCDYTTGGSPCPGYMDMATCDSDPACMWDMGMMICNDAPVTGCALYNTDQITCESAPENCYWDMGTLDCYPNGSVCGSYVDMATCDSDPACMWDMGMMICNDAAATGCALYNTDQITCESAPENCYWDPGTFDCYPNGGDPCSPLIDQATCEADTTCWWDPSLFICVTDTNAGCGGWLDMASCDSDPMCQWDPGMMICNDAAATGCALYNTDQITCESAPENCYWDMGALDCYPNGSVCGSYMDMATCDSDPACMWDPGMMICNDAAATGCALYNTDQITCESAPENCYWDMGALDCYPNGSVCGSYMDMATCDSDPGCMWDPGMMICNDNGGSPCPGYMDMATCDSDPSCTWDPGIMVCNDAIGGCDQYDGTDQMTCESAPEGCVWDPVGFFCDPIGGPCSGYGDMATCDSDPMCMWDPGMMLCNDATSVCDGYMDMATCDSDPACTWDPGMMICNDVASICGGYADQITCEIDSMCLWDGLVCKEKLPCNQYTDAGTCDIDPACTWDPGMIVCNDNMSPCGGYMDMATCDSDPACMWDPGMMICNDNMGSCGGYMDMATCDSDPACMWDPGMMICNDNMGSCGGYMDMATCDSDPVCMWDPGMMICNPI